MMDSRRKTTDSPDAEERKVPVTRHGKRNNTRWVCFNDPAGESSGWVGGGGVGNIPTTLIQLAGAGSI